MTSLRNLLALVLTGVVCTASTRAYVDPEAAAQQRRAEILHMLMDTQVDLTDLPEEMPLDKFLAALEGKLPEGKKISLGIDDKAFCEMRAELNATKVRLSAFKGSLHSSLLRAMHAATVEMDYAVRPTGVVLTSPRFAAHRAVYDVHDIVAQASLLLSYWKKENPELYQDLAPDAGAALLVRMVANAENLEPWESIDILNDSRLVVFASPRRQWSIDGLLQEQRRLLDNAVLMNARLYEVDRTVFEKHIAPRLVGEYPEDRKVIVPLDSTLCKIISQQKIVAQSEDKLLRPKEWVSFLSLQRVVRYVTGPHPKVEGATLTGTVQTGLNFEVRPLISPDRRYIRVEINQNVSQLVSIGKTKKLDPLSGKEFEVEVPSLLKNSVSGAIQFPDGGGFLMPVAYQPANKDKILVLAAQPVIWIEEEERIRAGGKNPEPPQFRWSDEAVAEEEKPAPVTRLPYNDKTREILQAIVTNVLTNPELKRYRASLGTRATRLLPWWMKKNEAGPRGSNLLLRAIRRSRGKRIHLSMRIACWGLA